MLCQKKRNETLPGSKPSSDSPTEMRTPVGRKNDRRLQAGKQASENGTGTSAKFSLTHRKEGKASVKYMVIYRHRETYSISEMCRFFEVSRRGYYDYVKRMDNPDRDAELAELIRT